MLPEINAFTLLTDAGGNILHVDREIKSYLENIPGSLNLEKVSTFLKIPEEEVQNLLEKARAGRICLQDMAIENDDQGSWDIHLSLLSTTRAAPLWSWKGDRHDVWHLGEYSLDSKEIMNVFSSISENVTIQDKDLRLLYVNKAAAKSVNRKQEDLLGHHCYQVWDGKKAVCPRCPVKKAFKSGHYEEGENSTPDGKSWHIKAFPIMDNNKVKAVMEVTTDITAKKRAENAIIESEKKYRFIAENSSDVIFIQDLDLNYLFVSPSVKQVLGYEVDEIMQTQMHDTMTKESYEKALSKYKRFFKLAQEGEYPDIPLMQFEYIKKNGEKIWGEIKVGFLRNSDGKLVGSQGIFRDITQRVQGQEELKRAKQQAEDRENKLKEAQSLAHLGSWIHDFKTNVLEWSDEVFRILGYAPGAFPPDIDKFMEIVHPGDRHKFDEVLQNPGEKKEPFEIIHRIVRPSGEVRFVNERNKIVFDETGNPVRNQGTIQDITEIKKYEEALKLAKEKAEESDRLKSAFLANLTHEIRTPLNAILGFAELMKEPDVELGQKHKFADIIYEKGKDLLQILNDIIDISRIEARQLSLNPTYFSNNKLLQELHEFFLPYLNRQNKNVDFLLQLPLEEEDSLILGDRIKIQQVLSNLVSNAIKFTGRGQIEMGYQIKGGNGEKVIQYHVSDTGIGIDPRHHYHIFDRFQQIAEYRTREHSGTGLGLAISKSLVEMMGGKIWIDSQLNQGATFYFTIPYRNSGKLPHDRPRKRNPSPNWKGKRVLLVEDDKFAYMLLLKMLEKTGLEIVYADSGYKAIEVFNEDQDFDLVLLDIQLPGIDGYQVLEQIKKKTPGIPIVAQTAFAMDNHKQIAKEKGFNEYISKPVSKKNLLGTLKNYLG